MTGFGSVLINFFLGSWQQSQALCWAFAWDWLWAYIKGWRHELCYHLFNTVYTKISGKYHVMSVPLHLGMTYTSSWVKWVFVFFGFLYLGWRRGKGRGRTISGVKGNPICFLFANSVSKWEHCFLNVQYWFLTHFYKRGARD